jgi:tetratricopeptide (TPR) repeat protein
MIGLESDGQADAEKEQQRKLMTLLGLWVCTCLLAISPIYAQTGALARKSQQAHELMAAGKIEQALAIYRELVQASPNNPSLQLDLGMALHLAGRDREAILPLQAAVHTQPDLFPANLFLGAAFMGIGAPEKAIPPLTKAAKLQPQNPDLRQELAAALLSLGRFREAAEHYQKLAELVPQNPRAWAGLCQCYGTLSQEESEKLGHLAKDSGYWFALMAEARAESQQFKSAFYLYRQALERTPELRGVHSELAEIYRQTGHSDWAATEQGKERNLPAPNCTAKKAECDYFAGHYADAIAAAGPNDTPEALYWRTRAYNALANHAYAKLQQLPPSVESHELTAMLRRNQERYPEEVEEWRQALKFAPSDPQIETQLAAALIQVGENEAARKILQALELRYSESPIINYLLGDALFKLQKPTQGIPYLEKAVERDPHLLAAQSSLARAYVQVGEGPKAIPHLNAALPIDADGSLHYQLARAYTANGQPQLAQKILNEYQDIQKAKATGLQDVEKEVPISAPNN